MGNDSGGKEIVLCSGGRSVIPQTMRSDGYGSVEEHEMRNNQGSRKDETGEEDYINTIKQTSISNNFSPLLSSVRSFSIT